MNISCTETYKIYNKTECSILPLLDSQALDETNYIISTDTQFSDIKEIVFSTEIKTISIPDHLFERFPQLTHLHFDWNDVKEITANNFKGANSLHFLDLSYNRLERISFHVFFDAWALNNLLLVGNQIHTIDDYAFDVPFTLNYLDLSKNQLKKVTHLMFASLPLLQTLRLNENLIEEIDEDALNLPALKFLYLNGNKLKSFSESMFAQTPQLYTLCAENNDLQQVNNALNNLHKLEQLSLIDNQITDLDLKKLAKLENLQWLMLENNPLTLDSLNVSADDIATSRSRITELSLGHNGTEVDSVFQKLKLFPNLQMVSLTRMKFEHFDLEAIRSGGLTELSEIVISDQSFDENWLNETVNKLSMELEKEDSKMAKIIVNKSKANDVVVCFN